MKNILFLILFVLFAGKLYSQGFNWQYSYREPTQGPNLFIGGVADYLYFDHTGEFFLFENETVCCPYKGGTGNGFRLGLKAEYWWQGNTAFNVSMSYVKAGGKFTSLQEYPRINNIIQVVEFAYNSDLRYIEFDFAAKRRLFDSHFYGEVALGFMYKVSDNSTHIERVVSPAELPFSDGSTEREFPYREISGLRKFNFLPAINIGYDLNLGDNLYASICTGIKIPIMSQSGNNSWNRWQTGVSVSVYWGIDNYTLF